MKYIYDMHQMMLQNNIILVYEGEFTQEITKSVLAMAERNLDSIGEESGIKRKVFNVMVECLQNIVKHSDEYMSEQIQINSAIFMIGKHEDSYIITSGNPIRDEQVDGLKEKLDQINRLDSDGLKTLYKDTIKSSSGLTYKGGAGLGFVDMARKSGQKLEYGFKSLGDGRSFFSLKTTVPRI